MHYAAHEFPEQVVLHFILTPPIPTHPNPPLSTRSNLNSWEIVHFNGSNDIIDDVT